MKIFHAVLFLFVLTAVGSSQEKDKNEIPDFSGTWIIDNVKSGPEAGYTIGPSKLDMSLTIVHKDPEIKITQKTKGADGKLRTADFTYYTDGRKIGLRGKNDEDNFRKGFWKGRKLVKIDQYVLKKGDGMDWFLEKNKADSLKMDTREELELSKDGNTLTQKISGGTAPGVPPSGGFRYVFRRQT